MQAVSNLWKQIFAEPGHLTEVRAVIGGVTYNIDKIFSITQTRNIFSSNSPTIGCCCSSVLDIEIIPTSPVPRMAPIVVTTRLKSADGTQYSEWIDAGTYYVDTRSKERDGLTMHFTAYDSMLKADQPYLQNSEIDEWPCDENDVVDEIAALMGVTVDERTVLAGYDVNYPAQDWTMREVLGWIAAANCGNWIITPQNELYLIPLNTDTSYLGSDSNTAILFGDSLIILSTGYDYDKARDVLAENDTTGILFGDSLIVANPVGGGSAEYLGGNGQNIRRNARGMHNLGLLQAFTGVKLWYDHENSYVDQTEEVEGETTTEKVEVENAYTAGTEDGRVLEADCPWATQAMCNAILTKIEGYCYQGAVVDYAEITPAAELGDTVVCDGVTFSLAQASVTFDGAYAPTISAPADEEVDYEYRYESETQRQLNRKATLGENYYGFKVTRENGIEVVNIVDGVETTRMILNSSTQAFYNANGDVALYFDAEAGQYKFVGDVTVLSGSLNINNNFIVDTEGNVTTNGNVTLQGANTTITSPNVYGGKYYNSSGNASLEVGPNYGYDLVFHGAGYQSGAVFEIYDNMGSAYLKLYDTSILQHVANINPKYTNAFGEWRFGGEVKFTGKVTMPDGTVFQ